MRTKSGFLIANCYISKDGVHAIIEYCPVCGKRHLHGAEIDVQNIDGFKTLGFRSPHCIDHAHNENYLLVIFNKF